MQTVGNDQEQYIQRQNVTVCDNRSALLQPDWAVIPLQLRSTDTKRHVCSHLFPAAWRMIAVIGCCTCGLFPDMYLYIHSENRHHSTIQEGEWRLDLIPPVLLFSDELIGILKGWRDIVEGNFPQCFYFPCVRLYCICLILVCFCSDFTPLSWKIQEYLRSLLAGFFLE